MQNIHEHDDGVIDLGVASVDTQGTVMGDIDSIGLQLGNNGIADD
ncbi:benenodin family lasso peptide [Sphingobium sp. CFD-2]|nr:benenodin family lasso peptide [Sphingobium sp. CFD-2]